MKINYKNKILTAVAGITLLAVTSCKKYLDVNQNPNSPTTATGNLLLPSTQAAIGMAVGNNLQVFGGFYAQYWTQNPTSSQYKSIDQYQSNSSTFDRVWGVLYNDALEDISLLEQSKNSNYVSIALIEKAYIFQVLTDAFSDVPLKDALGGNDNLAPRYDSQREVYDSIFAWAKRGVALTTAATTNYPGTDDIIFGGGASGMANWKKFGNTMLLKAYLRLSEVDAAKAESGIRELYASNAEFLTADAKITYQNVGGNQNPLYAEGVGLGRTQNLVASSTAVDALKANNDPRLTAFYTTNSAGNVVGVPQGSFATQPAVAPTFPAPVTGARFASATGVTAATAPVKLISAPESYFLQAEAVARGWANGNAEQLFLSGIRSSFSTYAISAEETEAYLTSPAAAFSDSRDEMIKAIITQKYFAMTNTQGFEAWTEWRRTGYPNILVPSKATALGTNDLPARLLYPDTEITRNSNFPGLKLVTDKVWWDK